MGATWIGVVLCWLLLIVATPSWAAFEVSPLPLWVEVDSPGSLAPDELDRDHDRVYLLLDDQVSLIGTEPEHYTRFVARILRQSAIADFGSLQLQVATGFERLHLHGVTIWRDGEAYDRLASARVSVLQRESRLEEGLVDEVRTVLIVLEDIRIGDEIDVAFSRVGHNPGLGSLYARRLSLARSWPVLERSIRIAATEADFPNWRQIGGPPLNHEDQLEAGIRTGRWSASRLPAVMHDSEAPSWYRPEGYLELSSAGSWRDVAQWALPLYRPAQIDAALAMTLERIRAEHAEPEARLLAAVRFVQDEIRYTGISVDQHWYVPHPPTRVLARRYGDCKDKTLLLLTLLDALGIEAQAALVSTRFRQQVRELAASPYAFDHVIVRFRYGGRWYWIDPTAELQRGRLSEFAQADFGVALVVSETSDELTTMPEPSSDSPDVDIQEIFDLRDARGRLADAGSLTIVTEYRSASADRVRGQFARSSPLEIGRGYLNFLLRYYDHVEQVEPPSWHDDEEGNRFLVTERYRLPQPWLPTAEDRNESSFMLSVVHSHASLPSARVRQAPLLTSHPNHVVQRIKVLLDSGWPERVEEHEHVNEHFSLHARMELGNSSLLMTGRYRSHSHQVDVEAVDAYVAELISARGSLNYTLTTSLVPAAEKELGSGLSESIVGLLEAMLTTRAQPPSH